MEQQDYYSEEESSQQKPTSRNKKRDNIKRFSDEQVKLLESVFSRGTKIEPRKKLQLARDIGLQPRQVSIWFQNKRARWKTKQLEQEYKVLKDKFDDLYEQFESMKKEKETLLDQFNSLRRLLENSEDVKIRDWGNRDEVFDVEQNNEEDSKYFRQEEKPQTIVNNFSGGGEEGSLLAAASYEEHHNLVSGCHFDELCCPSSWWEL